MNFDISNILAQILQFILLHCFFESHPILMLFVLIEEYHYYYRLAQIIARRK